MYPDLYYLFREVVGLEWPFLRHFTTFGFSIALSFIAGYFFLKKYLLEKEHAGHFISKKACLVDPDKPAKVLPSKSIATWSLLAAIGGIVGGKIFYLLENYGRPASAPELFSFAGINFYGSLCAALLVTCVFSYLNNIKPLHLLDATAPGFMIAYCIGRLGCHVSGDGDWGRVNNMPKPFDWMPDGLWAYRYPHNLIREGSIMPRCDWGNYCYQLDQPVFPTSLWEAIICFLLFLCLWRLRRTIAMPGVLFSIFLIFSGVERFLVEMIRINPVINALNITQAQLISILLILIGIIIMVTARKKAFANKSTGLLS